MVSCDVQEHRRLITKEKQVLEAELEYERLLRKQELLKREKEHKKELQSVREELETEKQKLPNVQEVQLSHTNMYPTYDVCMGTLALSHDIQEQIIENDSQSLETLSLQAFSNVSTWHIAIHVYCINCKLLMVT